MPNLWAPRAPLPPLPADDEQPINYKATVLGWIVCCAAMFAMDIRSQKLELREAQAARELAEPYNTPAAPCLHAHCRDGQHVYRQDFDNPAESAGTEA